MAITKRQESYNPQTMEKQTRQYIQEKLKQKNLSEGDRKAYQLLLENLDEFFDPKKREENEKIVKMVDEFFDPEKMEELNKKLSAYKERDPEKNTPKKISSHSVERVEKGIDPRQRS